MSDDAVRKFCGGNSRSYVRLLASIGALVLARWFLGFLRRGKSSFGLAALLDYDMILYGIGLGCDVRGDFHGFSR